MERGGSASAVSPQATVVVAEEPALAGSLCWDLGCVLEPLLHSVLRRLDPTICHSPEILSSWSVPRYVFVSVDLDKRVFEGSGVHQTTVRARCVFILDVYSLRCVPLHNVVQDKVMGVVKRGKVRMM